MLPPPKVLLPTGRDQKSVDIPTCLLRERIVFLGEGIVSSTANSLIQQLLYLRSQDATAPSRRSAAASSTKYT